MEVNNGKEADLNKVNEVAVSEEVPFDASSMLDTEASSKVEAEKDKEIVNKEVVGDENNVVA